MIFKFLLTTFTIAIFSSASAHTFFVSPDGNDSGSGSKFEPWATVNHAANLARPGDVILIHGGHYVLSSQVRVRRSGRPEAWITFKAYPGEKPILDAHLVPRNDGPLSNGAFQIERVSFVRVANLFVIDSQDAGFTVRDSSHVDLISNSTTGTYSSGIAVWSTNHDNRATECIRVLGNSVTRANIGRLIHGEAPHEAISVGGAINFEVAYNHVYDSDKEGIDIKENSKFGLVHHNLVENVARQCLYLDAWYGELSDIQVFSNALHDCHSAGIVLSVEQGLSMRNIKIHDNIVFKNYGSGLVFSFWGANNFRRNIEISRNIFYRNGFGPPSDEQEYFWITGGIYLATGSIDNVSIVDNTLSENKGFQIGYSTTLLKNYPTWMDVVSSQHLTIACNLVDGPNSVDTPIRGGGLPADRVMIFATLGNRPTIGKPSFKDPDNEDFSRPGRPLVPWWKTDYPPRIALPTR
jgi:Right handed beta helix region